MMKFWRWYRKNDQIFTTILSVLMLIVLVCSIALFAMNKADPNSNAVLKYIGYQPIYVQTGSMEPTMVTKGIVLVERVDSMDDIAIDDIITYRVYDGSGKAITITHRIYNIKEDGTIITKGDNNRVADSYSITIDNVLAKVVWIWNGAADIQKMLTTPMGIMMALVGVAIIVLIFYAIGQFGKYLDEKYGINEDVADSVNDQLKADNQIVLNENNDIEETPEMKTLAALPPDQQIPQLLESERNSWQRIYNYDVSKDNLITITGVKKNFASLTEISVPKEIRHKKVVGIGAFAFKNSNATIIHLPETLEFIDKAAFYHCADLIYVNIPNTVKRIGANAFDGCKSLMDIKLPVNLTRIEDKAFNNCVGIESLTINDKVVAIGDSAFNGCDNLTTIYGAKAVKLIKLNAFKTNREVSTNIITDNDYMKNYNWELYGRKAVVIDDPDMLAMVYEDNQQLVEEYEKQQEEIRIEKEQQLTSKISRQIAKFGEKRAAKNAEADEVQKDSSNESDLQIEPIVLELEPLNLPQINENSSNECSDSTAN